jgi:hypothetical protein
MKIRFALITTLCATMLSCEEESPVIAEVENSRLQVNALMEIKGENSGIPKEEWVRRIDSWVSFEVMYKEAIKKDLHKDPAVQKLIKDAEKKILIDRLRLSLDSIIDEESDKELRDFYESNMELFRIDSVSFAEFPDVVGQIRLIVTSEKRLKREKKWLAEVKNNYNIEVYPQYLDLLK